jgi:hypothetical protein
MARGDIVIYDEGAFGYPGDDEFSVAAGTAISIKAGEPVVATLGGYQVAAMATSKPAIGTDYLVGIAASDSTDTASAVGKVKVTKPLAGITYLISPKVPATWDTQAEYDLLVGDRVTLDLTGATWTINATDSSLSGCVVMPLDVKKYPGKVRFAIREGAKWLAYQNL